MNECYCKSQLVQPVVFFIVVNTIKNNENKKACSGFEQALCRNYFSISSLQLS